MRNWTKDQLAAIEARDCNLLVSAAAGSGKTALLIERIKRLILDEGVDVRELLVMTFTRAAASEMKERLRQALTEALGAGTSDFERIADQLNRLNRASISTLDAFCSAFLRENFQAAGIAPDFKIGSEAELKMLRRESIEEVLEGHYAQIPENGSDDFAEMAEMFGANRSDEPLIQLILDFYTFLRTLPDPEGWCTEALAHFDCTAEDFFQTFWGGEIRHYATEQVKQAKKCLAEAMDTAGDHPVFQRTKVILEKEQAQAAALDKILSEGDFQTFSASLSDLTFQRYYGGRPKEEDDKLLGGVIKENRQTAKDILVDLQKDYGRDSRELSAAISEMKSPVSALIAVTRDFKQAYFDKKQRRGLLDFSDTEQLTLQILKENPLLRREMRKKYRYVFMDEYQDTNGIQEAILQCIVRENNYFMVGDVKQSIYRFRLADPGIFIDKLRHFDRDHSESSGKNRLIALGQNFRSSAAVIDSVNTVFEKVMTEKVGEVAYDARAKLYRGLPDSGSVMPTEIHLLSKDQKDASDDEAEVVSLSAVEQEAFYIASKIQEMVGQPLYRTRAGKALPLRYSDIGILMRGVTGKGPVFRRVFKDAGIPLYFDGGETYYETTEVTLILNLLKLIDNPLQDLPLLAYILSPIGGFTVEDCAAIRQDSDTRYFHQAFWHYAEQHAKGNGELKDRIIAFDDQLKAWRDNLHLMDIQSFLWKIYRETGYYTFVGGLPGGEQRQSNLRQLLSKAAAYRKSTMKGLFHFVRFVEDLRHRKIDDMPPGLPEGQENAVQLMTIHKSKGLEFPIVFIAGAAGQFNTAAAHQPVFFHKDLGICPECIRIKKNQRFPTAAYTLCKERQRVETLSEEMRLLYVAMTRAEERLFFVGSLSEKQLSAREKKWQTEPDDYFCSHVRGTLDWVMMAIQNQPACFKIISVENPTAVLSRPKPIVVQASESGDYLKEREKIRARLSWHYPYGENAVIPEKLSVTGISKIRRHGSDSQELPNCSPRPLFMQQLIESGQSRISSRQWTGAELGTAIHGILSDLNLDTVRRSKNIASLIAEHADEMVQADKLSADLRQALNLDSITGFFESDLGQRLLNAKTIWREKPFNYSIAAGRILKEWQGFDEKVVVQGMIDCCFLEGNEWVLLDYKTDWYHNREEIENLRRKYSEQVSLYAEALEVLTGKKVKEKLLVLLKGNDTVKIEE